MAERPGGSGRGGGHAGMGMFAASGRNRTNRFGDVRNIREVRQSAGQRHELAGRGKGWRCRRVTALACHSPGTSQPWHVTVLACHSLGTSQPWHITALAYHSLGTSQPWHITALAHHSPGMSKPWHITALARHSPGTSQPWHVTALARRPALPCNSTGHSCAVLTAAINHLVFFSQLGSLQPLAPHPTSHPTRLLLSLPLSLWPAVIPRTRHQSSCSHSLTQTPCDPLHLTPLHVRLVSF